MNRYRDIKLTKAQLKDLERVDAWLNGRPFRESSRQKERDLTVPALSIEDVMAQYIPPAVSSSGQFFTPLEMSEYLYEQLYYSGILPLNVGERVLDPCGGIGHLLYHLPGYFDSSTVRLTAYELEQECVGIGQKLFPWANWRWAIPFECLPDIEGQYDLVVMNPPFGDVRRGMAAAELMSAGRAKLAEHLFLELAIRALKPNGVAVVIAPYNLLDKMPKALRQWFDERAELEEKSQDTLPGEFKLTKVRVHAYVIRRREPAAAVSFAPVPALSSVRQMSLFG